MTVNSFRLPAKIYTYLAGNQNRPVPFEELCAFVHPSDKDELFNESFSTEIQYQTRIMQLLLFLSDLNLITLNQLTDESHINMTIAN